MLLRRYHATEVNNVAPAKVEKPVEKQATPPIAEKPVEADVPKRKYTRKKI